MSEMRTKSSSQKSSVMVVFQKHNKVCVSCARKGKVPWNKGIPHTAETLEEISKSLVGRVFSKEWTENISKAHRKRLSSKLRGSNRNPRYNLGACKLFDSLNQILGWNGQHGTNGGEFYISELGYWLDYYEPTHNIVIEYDEVHHKRRKLKAKDRLRQARIENVLDCKFYRVVGGQTTANVLSMLLPCPQLKPLNLE